jgi:phospholipase C
MVRVSVRRTWRERAIASLLFVTLTPFAAGPVSAHTPGKDDDKKDHHETETPIKHVIVLIGENRTFDHLFATYVPQSKDSINNLLSEGIIKADGTPGKNFGKAAQFQAIRPFKTKYFISLDSNEKASYSTLPEPTLNFSPSPATGEPPPFPAGTPTSLLAAIEPSLETKDLGLLTTGSSGAAQTAELPDFDSRIKNFSNLPNGPFPLEGANLPYDSYTGDTTHRLFEMWQQSDCNISNATRQNPSGCLNDLYPFVITTYTSEPDPFSFPVANEVDDNGGGNSMAFYNMQAGDVPVFKSLADQYSISDNFHQSFMGGTGANHFMLGTGDAIFWTDPNGNPIAPPAGVIANPDPLPGSDNQYTVDIGFNGNFAECADATQPGIKPIRDYLKSLPYAPNPNCEPKHYYMVNNNNPGFLPTGAVDTAGIAKGTSVPPTNIRTIGEALSRGLTTVALSMPPSTARMIPRARIRLCRLGELTATSATLNHTQTRSWAMRRNARLISKTRRTSSPPLRTAHCQPCRLSNRMASWTGIRRLRSSISSKRW